MKMINIMKYYLLYNDGKYELNRLIISINQYLPEFNVIVFNKEDIDSEFKEKYDDILKLKRGGGYWLWKPYIINRLLNVVNNGDIIFYSDTMYYFTELSNQLLDPLNDILVWRNKPNEPNYLMKNWCKSRVIVDTNICHEVFEKNAEICWAGALVLRKNEFTVKLMNDWLNLCCTLDYIIDTPENNHKEFIEHRHDQSLLSVILIKNNIPLQTFPNKYLQNVRCPY